MDLLILVGPCDVVFAKNVTTGNASQFKAAILFQLRSCVRTFNVENVISAPKVSVSDDRSAFLKIRVSSFNVDHASNAAMASVFPLINADFHLSIYASEFNAASAEIALEVFVFVVLAALLIHASSFSAEIAKFATVESVFPIPAAFRLSHLSTRV